MSDKTTSEPSTRASKRMERVPIADALRGLSALLITWHHLTGGDPSFLQEGAVKASGRYLYVAVQVFFVISGFVLPYSMRAAGYHVGRFRSFITRRVVRLDPPYFAAVVMCLMLNWASTLVPGYRGKPFVADLPSWLAHVGYLNGVLGWSWATPQLWTLAIEFQFYLLFALSFHVMTKWSARSVLIGAAMLGVGYVLREETAWLFPYSGLFLLGITSFMFRVGELPQLTYGAVVAVVTLATSATLGVEQGITAAATALAVAFYKGHVPRWLEYSGTISYSLYLVHVAVGGRVVNMSIRLTTDPWLRTGAAFVAFGLSIVAAICFYRLIERPAIRWSTKFRYGKDHAPRDDHRPAA